MYLSHMAADFMLLICSVVLLPGFFIDFFLNWRHLFFIDALVTVLQLTPLGLRACLLPSPSFVSLLCFSWEYITKNPTWVAKGLFDLWDFKNAGI